MSLVKRKSITKRWLLNSLGIAVAVMMIVEVLALIVAWNYYNMTVRQYLVLKLENVTSDISNYSTPSGFSSEVKSIVERFDEKDRYELMALDSRGEVVLSSSGFQAAEWMQLEDYREARDSADGEYTRVIKLGSGERVMVHTMILPGPAYEYSAMR